MINEVDDGLIIITADAGMFVPKSVDSENDLISISDDVETVTINLSELTPWIKT